MAYIPRELPVLTGKAARDFYKQAAKATVSKSDEEILESLRTYKFLKAEQERLHPRTIW
jgi:hypothetical protein